jgi:hypothetical protein
VLRSPKAQGNHTLTITKNTHDANLNHIIL